MTNALLDEDTEGTATVIVIDWGSGKYIRVTNFFLFEFLLKAKVS